MTLSHLLDNDNDIDGAVDGKKDTQNSNLKDIWTHQTGHHCIT